MELDPFFARHAPEVTARLATCLAELRRTGHTRLPLAAHPDDPQVPIRLARLVHRAWLHGRPWGPLVVLHPRHRPTPGDIRSVGRYAAGGLVYLAGPLAPDPASAVREAREAGVALLTTDGDETPHLLAPAAHHRLLQLDAHASVATDPTLTRARAALRAHATRGDAILIRGSTGSGRAALAREAQASLSEAPLPVVDRAGLSSRGAQPEAAVSATGWCLVRDLDELPEGHPAGLLARLDQLDAVPLAPVRPVLGADRPRSSAFAALIGEEPSFCAALAEAEMLADGRLPVLILGETGTGKEPLARAIHEASGRRGELVPVDIGSRADGSNLLDDELFGHAVNAFQGATRERAGAFRQAHLGTVFLDECENLSPEQQAKLLRVLETGEVKPLGSDRTVRVDVRIVAASNVDLDALVRAGRFRSDLLFRLNGGVIRLPPLRDRRGDIPRLAAHLARRHGGEGCAVSDAAAERLMAGAWPGNVRELEKVVQRALMSARTRAARAGLRTGSERAADRLEILREDLPGPLREAEAPGPLLVTAAPEGFPDWLPRRHTQLLSAVTVHVPAPAERGPLAIRNAALHALAGRPVRPEALALLEAWPWWGKFNELRRCLDALAQAPDGPITADTVLGLFPTMTAPPGREPIVSLQHPSADERTGVTGMIAEHHEAALVIGRITHPSDLGDPARDPRARARIDWLGRHADPSSVAYLDFRYRVEISRLHLLVTRQPEGLWLHRAPGTPLEVVAGHLLRAPEAVPPEGGVALGPAGVVRILAGDKVVLELFLALGRDELTRAAPLILGGRHAPAVTQRDLGPARRAWALSDVEARILLDLLLAHVLGEGELAPRLRTTLTAAGGPAKQLFEYTNTNNVAQSVRRLLSHEPNRVWVERFAEELDAHRAWDRAEVRLPGDSWDALFERPPHRS